MPPQQESAFAVPQEREPAIYIKKTTTLAIFICTTPEPDLDNMLTRISQKGYNNKLRGKVVRMQKKVCEKLLFFEKLLPEEQAQIEKSSHEKKYERGERVFSKGEPGTAVWFVKQGRVHLQNISYDGKVTTACVMSEGDLFCCLPALDGKAYPADAIAVEASTIIKIPGDLFRELMHKNAAFSNHVMNTFCNRLRQMETRGCQTTDPAEVRVARLLLSLGDKFKNQIPLTRQEMADIAGLTIETTIRILSRMKKDGLIDSTRKMTHLTDVEKLKELAVE